MKFKHTVAIALTAVVAAPATVLAHPGHELTGLGAGIAHPLMGLDHFLAMLAVGVWAAMQPARIAWQGPAAFLAMLAVGAGLGLAGVGLPLVEPGVAASVILFGLLICGAAFVPASASLAMIGGFALLHGHAHGAEAVAPIGGYAAGFILASACLHLGGYAIGRRLTKLQYGIATAGALIAAAGTALALG